MFFCLYFPTFIPQSIYVLFSDHVSVFLTVLKYVTSGRLWIKLVAWHRLNVKCICFKILIRQMSDKFFFFIWIDFEIDFLMTGERTWSLMTELKNILQSLQKNIFLFSTLFSTLFKMLQSQRELEVEQTLYLRCKY